MRFFLRKIPRGESPEATGGSAPRHRSQSASRAHPTQRLAVFPLPGRQTGSVTDDAANARRSP